jgi:phospholipid transport system substrate-binding protein
MRLRAFLILFAFVAGLGAARAEADSPAAGFVNALVSDAVATLKDNQLSEQARDEKLQSLLTRGFDIPRIARYVLGRYWRDASDAERADFTSLFQQWVVKTYSARLANYAGETVEVTGARNEPDGTVVASRIVHPSGPPTMVEWRLEGQGGDFKIIDIDVEGVSLALTEREEVAATISRGGGTIEAINSALKQKLAAQSTADAH